MLLVAVVVHPQVNAQGTRDAQIMWVSIFFFHFQGSETEGWDSPSAFPHSNRISKKLVAPNYAHVTAQMKRANRRGECFSWGGECM